MKSIINIFLALLIFSISAEAQQLNNKFFNDVNSFLEKNVTDGRVDYASLKSDAKLQSLISVIENVDLSSADLAEKKAFYINAYNLHVINQALSAYPLESVQSIGGFFDGKKVKVAGKTQTLNQLEKDNLLKPYNDARLHFVLVCGALGCPPITDFAYTPAELDRQLTQQTKIALNDPTFLKVNGTDVELSQIFNWYTSDFGGSKSTIIEFINKYRNSPLDNNSKIKYYQYDWTLNDNKGKTSAALTPSAVGNNSTRYIVSSTIPKGSIEIKVFNNLYSQKTVDNESGELANRSSFFTTSISALYGLSNRFNIGINTRYRKVRNNALPSSPFSVFGSDNEGSSRSGITAIGPQIRYAPVPKWENFSIQSSFVFPVGQELSGNSNQPYIDWDGATWNTQIFNDFPIGNNFSLFTELDVLLEDIGNVEEGRNNRFSTPVTAIFSYNPNNKTTLYTLGGYSPFWGAEFDYFAQFGAGAKYQFTPKFEIELLYTDFTNKFLAETNGQAATFNLGLRFNL